MNLKNLIYKIDVGIEEFLLVLLILLNIFDFFALLNPEWDFIKKIISWTVVGYLIYQASPSDVFFGVRNRIVDAVLVFAYFFMIFNKAIYFVKILFDDLKAEGIKITYDISVGNVLEISQNIPHVIYTSIGDFFVSLREVIGFYFLDFFKLILNNQAFLETIFLYLGGAMLILLALSPLFREVRVKEPSILSIFIEEDYLDDKPKNTFKKIYLSFIVFMAFFVIVFNLFMEWLAFAIDSPTIIIGIIAYFLFVIKNKHRFSGHGIIAKVGSFGEGFYTNFLNQFKYRNTLLWGILGMLVLHLVTDIGIFMMPYLIGFKNALYFSNLGIQSTFLWTLLNSDLGSVSNIVDKISLMIVYLFNIIGFLLLLLMPAYIWFGFYKDLQFRSPKLFLAIFFSGLSAFLISPVFSFSRIETNSLFGVSILINQIQNINFIQETALIVIGIFTLIFALSYVHLLKQFFVACSLVISTGFFGLYIYHFFMDTILKYSPLVYGLLVSYDYFAFLIFLFIMVITSVFYVLGFLTFAYEIVVNFTKKFI